MGLCTAKENQKNDVEYTKVEIQKNDVQIQNLKHQQIMKQTGVQLELAIFEQEHNSVCESIETCSSVSRIIKYLIHYQKIDITKTDNIYHKDNYPYLVDDFHHILLQHLSD
eukprot:554505_1